MKGMSRQWPKVEAFHHMSAIPMASLAKMRRMANAVKANQERCTGQPGRRANAEGAFSAGMFMQLFPVFQWLAKALPWFSSEERRVVKERGSQCRTRGAP